MGSAIKMVPQGAAPDAAGSDQLSGCVQSLVRAFGILDQLARGDSLTLSELAMAVDLPRSTTHRMLTTMEAMRYVGFDRETNRWSIGVQAFALGVGFAQSRNMGQVGREVMQTLARDTHHCVNMAIPEASGICYVDQIMASGDPQTAARPGIVLPLHMTAAGKVIMAHWPKSRLDQFLDRQPLAARTGKSIVDADLLRQQLVQVRECGFAIDDEEYDSGLRCVATTVFDRLGGLRGALSVSDQSDRLTRSRLGEIGPALVQASRGMAPRLAPRSA